MLTIFSVPKPFVGHTETIQRNAIASWRNLGQDVNVVLCGNEHGTAEVASEFGAIHVPEIACNSYGTPLLDNVFQSAYEAWPNSEYLCYVNGDIIFMEDLLAAVQRIPWRDFLMVGRRTNLDIRKPIDFSQPDWSAQLRAFAKERGKLAADSAIDYMLFPKRTGLHRIRPFTVGRPAWDNWFLYHAISRHIPIVDATKSVTVVHQNHNYDHVPNAVASSWEGPEANMNRLLALDMLRTVGYCTIADATVRLEKDSVQYIVSIQKGLVRVLRGIANRIPRLELRVRRGGWLHWGLAPLGKLRFERRRQAPIEEVFPSEPKAASPAIDSVLAR